MAIRFGSVADYQLLANRRLKRTAEKQAAQPQAVRLRQALPWRGVLAV
jgi:hypothetical protein